MKKLILGLLVLALFLGITAAADTPKDPYDIQVKNLYSTPDDSSNKIYAIPIEVKLLDVSADTNWYKVKISYRIGPLSYTYVGWTEIPVGDIIAARQKAMDEVAKVTPPAEVEQIEQ